MDLAKNNFSKSILELVNGDDFYSVNQTNHRDTATFRESLTSLQKALNNRESLKSIELGSQKIDFSKKPLDLGS